MSTCNCILFTSSLLTFLALFIGLPLALPLPMGNLGLICGNPCGGKSRGLGLMGGPQSLIPFGPIIGGIKGGTIPRPLGPNIKGGTPGPGLIGPIPGGGRGNIILCRIGPNIAGGPPIGGGGIRGGIPGIGGRTP